MGHIKFECFDETFLMTSANVKFDLIKQYNFDKKTHQTKDTILMKKFDTFAPCFNVKNETLNYKLH